MVANLDIIIVFIIVKYEGYVVTQLDLFIKINTDLMDGRAKTKCRPFAVAVEQRRPVMERSA